MAIVVKTEFVTENILDQDGNKLGEIKFNPNDARIMSKLSKVVTDLTSSLKKIKGIGEVAKIPQGDLETLEDFEKVAESFEKIGKGFEIEEQAITGVINDLTEIFGAETVNLFTGGTADAMLLMPLLEFIMPYVKEAREKKVGKYLAKQGNADVME